MDIQLFLEPGPVTQRPRDARAEQGNLEKGAQNMGKVGIVADKTSAGKRKFPRNLF